MLEICNSNDSSPKKNAFLRMMQNQRKFSTTTNHSFNKSAGTGCNEVKKLIIDQFTEEGIEGSYS